MIDFLREHFGFSAEERPWDTEADLPRFLRSGRKYSILSIDGADVLIIHIKDDGFNLRSFLKQTEKLQAYWKGEMALCFDRLSVYQRKALIGQRISFIVPGAQVYMPFLGILLRERREAAQIPPRRSFSAVAQYVFLFMLYRPDEFPMTKTALAHRTDLSAMTITRAVRELQQLGLIRVETAGRSDRVSPACTGKELLQLGEPYLIDPVVKRICVRSSSETDRLPGSGEAALSELSMLSGPVIPVRAISQKDYTRSDRFAPIDEAWEISADCVRLEVWAYDPCFMAQDGHVDPLSLYASLKGNRDERIEEAVEKLMEGCKW